MKYGVCRTTYQNGRANDELVLALKNILKAMSLAVMLV